MQAPVWCIFDNWFIAPAPLTLLNRQLLSFNCLKAWYCWGRGGGERQEVGAERVGTKKVLWKCLNPEREDYTNRKAEGEKTVQGCSQKQTTNWRSISSISFYLMLLVCFRLRGRRMDYTVPMLLLTMLLCSSCFCELEAKNPDVEEQDKAGLKSSLSTTHIPVTLGREHLRRSEQMGTQQETSQSPLPFLRETSHQSARRG